MTCAYMSHPRLLVNALAAGAILLIAVAIAAEPEQRFTYPRDGVVHDTRTDLLWMRCTIGQTPGNTRCLGDAEQLSWTEVISRVESLRGDGCAWRLPEFHELRSLLDTEERDPAIDPTAFPDTPKGWFWTRTRAAGHSQHDCFVNFSGTGTTRCNMGGRLYVRLVADASCNEP